jgi:hypothetical protein
LSTNAGAPPGVLPVSAVPGISVAATFAGDTFRASSTANTTAIFFAYLSRGAFVIGDKSAVVGATVAFRSSNWSNTNSLWGGPSPSSFNRFAGTL